MIGTLIWRIKEAIAVLSGKKKTLTKLSTPQNFPESNLKNLQPYCFGDREEKYISSKNIEFIFSEFNEKRVNAGGANFNTSSLSRLDPSLSTLKRFFPSAKYTVYSDFDLYIDGVDLVRIKNPILQNDIQNPRHFYHLADYYKFKGMLNSKADFAISIDSDMFIWNDNILSLIALTEKFGFCVPNSSAQSMNSEITMFLDTIPINDASKGFGTNCNITPMTFDTKSERGKAFYTECCNIMEQEPSRASIVMWKASWKTGMYPYVLPREFCVCRGSEGIGNEVILHVGHPSVAEYYNIKI